MGFLPKINLFVFVSSVIRVGVAGSEGEHQPSHHPRHHRHLVRTGRGNGSLELHHLNREFLSFSSNTG